MYPYNSILYLSLYMYCMVRLNALYLGTMPTAYPAIQLIRRYVATYLFLFAQYDRICSFSRAFS